MKMCQIPIEELDEGDDILYENLDELLIEFTDTIEVSTIFVQMSLH